MTSDTAVCVRAIPDAKCAYNSSSIAFVIGTLCHLWSVITAIQGPKYFANSVALLISTCDLFKRRRNSDILPNLVFPFFTSRDIFVERTTRESTLSSVR